MAAAIRFSRRHLSLTGTNPSVGTLIVRDGVIVGRGVTALGGRPHAEPQAIEEAGELARGATAYVTLEPCAHHGRTPPCANALVAAGVARVVGAANDPDERVSGKGYAILRAAGVEVTERVLADEAADLMSGYLVRSVRKRPEVILKLALSSDGMIGKRGAGQVSITGPVARAQVHLMRAECDAVLVGVGTAIADDPDLTVRLSGLQSRSPSRIVLDPSLRLPVSATLVQTANSVPTYLTPDQNADQSRRETLGSLGVRFLASEMHEGRIALPELLEDLAGQGMSRIFVEGGADTARAFLMDDLVDRIILFRGPDAIGSEGILSPLDENNIPQGFEMKRKEHFGADLCREWVRKL
ncbi:bifunctional diaminohydroxyphosphoribosylaminopyrimidine deaminase/5-amino-6-(5-phosphoribosylamino)uracil reductase RibD [Mesorhizobium denitrificans]|uniref:Riboflavin biosynthesis protein RibD n=2 Tax=Mesorhizobium TaxID=68287 RepID=A0A371X8V7_9HYPH|nr:bifunctional diaminohydroxyphosphoribosylaminopyrimidine deaminase/5-amino-6-(5-phosphoribosylamino)uracil reductase RibD [Mesorhizobium denitrificans]